MTLVLIVDDDEMFQEVSAEILESHGLLWVSAGDGLEALQKLQEGLEPDYIILDLQMPTMDGITFLEYKKRSRWSAIPVFVCSNDIDRWAQELNGTMGVYEKDDIRKIAAAIADICRSPQDGRI